MIEAVAQCSTEGPTWQWQPLLMSYGELCSEQTLDLPPVVQVRVC